jgi:hypothetical protein
MTTTERKPRPHAEVIKAWADGAKVEYFCIHTQKWLGASTPSWSQPTLYRIKPEPKEPTTWYQVVFQVGRQVRPSLSGSLYRSEEDWNLANPGVPVLKLIPIYTEENVE